MSTREQFEKWARKYVHKSPEISKREYGNNAYTAGYIQGVEDEKNRISKALKELEKK